MQSSPSLVGSHLSDGSSMQIMPPIHLILLGPPQGCLMLDFSPEPATQVPGQFRPSLVGSQLSDGSSTQDMPREHLMALGPPQGRLFLWVAVDGASDAVAAAGSSAWTLLPQPRVKASANVDRTTNRDARPDLIYVFMYHLPDRMQQ